MWQQEFELTREKMEKITEYGADNVIHFYYLNNDQVKKIHSLIEQIRAMDKLGMTHHLLDGMIAELPKVPKEQK